MRTSGPSCGHECNRSEEHGGGCDCYREDCLNSTRYLPAHNRKGAKMSCFSMTRPPCGHSCRRQEANHGGACDCMQRDCKFSQLFTTRKPTQPKESKPKKRRIWLCVYGEYYPGIVDGTSAEEVASIYALSISKDISPLALKGPIKVQEISTDWTEVVAVPVPATVRFVKQEEKERP